MQKEKTLPNPPCEGGRNHPDGYSLPPEEVGMGWKSKAASVLRPSTFDLSP